jgi:hypothetical protein
MWELVQFECKMKNMQNFEIENLMRLERERKKIFIVKYSKGFSLSRVSKISKK